MGAVLHRRRPVDPDGYTIEMAEHLLPDNPRFELHGGRIVVMSPAKRWHTQVQRRIADLLERTGRVAGIEVGLTVAPKEMRVLDVATFRNEPGGDRAYFKPGEITLAVKVASPSSEDDDYFGKPELYALLGIGEFWRADRTDDGVIMVEMFALNRDDRVYVPTGTATLEELEQRAGR